MEKPDLSVCTPSDFPKWRKSENSLAGRSNYIVREPYDVLLHDLESRRRLFPLLALQAALERTRFVHQPMMVSV
jgi:hypothetical protein